MTGPHNCQQGCHTSQGPRAGAAGSAHKPGGTPTVPGPGAHVSTKDSLCRHMPTSRRNAGVSSLSPWEKRGPFPPPPPTRSPWEGQGNVSGPFTTGQVCRRNSSQTLHPKKLGEILDLREEKGACCASIPTVPLERGWGRTHVPTQGFSQVKAGLGDPSWRRPATWPVTERRRDQG